jgi:signal transduction histidine kinase/CheY-like chemotaxis protein
MAGRSVAISLLLFAAVAALGGAVVWQANRAWSADRREAVSHAAAGAAFALEQQVSQALSATYALATLVHRDPSVEGFDRIAAEMLPHHGAVANLQLAPGAVVRQIYPLAGNEKAIGHDLLRDPDRRLQAAEAIASRRLTVAGPFPLVQGGVGLLGRLAVFLPSRGAEEGDTFWGFVTALVRVPALLDAARLSRLEQDGYRYRLERYNPERQRVDCFAGCDARVADPVTFQVSVPNGAWTLAVAPAAGWPRPGWLLPAWATVFFLASAFALLGLQLARQPELLRREVAARTADLRRAHAALAEDMERRRAAEEAARVAQEQLRQAQKLDAIGQLAGGIAHDFNNLLTGILGYASVLREESAPGTTAQEAAETIGAAAQRASELTRQLLGFARRRPLQAVPFDAHAIVEDVSQLLERTVDGRVRLTRAFVAARPVVVGDPGQLRQALLHLATNARDAMPDGGELRIESGTVERDAPWAARHPGATPGPHLAISVSDTGRGISAEARERIFEPFFTTKAPGTGTGLGLAMVYGIARAHGGAVEVESEVGHGARFTLSLPLAPPGVEPVPPDATPVPHPAAAGTVLVVDDDPVPRGAAAAMLGAAGWKPVQAASAEEAVAWLASHPGEAHTALVDVVMPGTCGVDCLAELRRLDPGLRAVFVSGFARDARVQELAARGEAGFLGKPYTREQLAAALDSAPAGPGAPRTVAA